MPSHQARLDAVVALAERGRQKEAEAMVRTLVAEGARLPRACMVLGVLCGERGDRAQRRLWLQEARRLEEAAGDPPSLRLLLNLQVDALEEGELERALALGKEALELHPGDGEALLHQARVFTLLGDKEGAGTTLEQAIAALRERVAMDPQDGKGWRLLATAEQNAGRVDGAIEAHQRALGLEPNHLPTLLACGQLLVERGQIDGAMPWLMNALAIAPDRADVLSLMGCALREIGETDQAIDLFRQALTLDPLHEEACLGLGGCLCDQGLFSEAAEVFRKGLEGSPGHLNMRSGLGACLRSLGEFPEALAIFEGLYLEKPEEQGAFNNLMFTTSITELVSPQSALNTAQEYWGRKGITPQGVRFEPPAARAGGGRPLRVGVLSADIGSHVVGKFLHPLLRHHDASRCRLELISMKRRYESSSAALIAMADGFLSLQGLSAHQARDLMRQQDYDLILDTSGYTRGSGLHLLAERCAPIQAHYIGYHASTGLPTLDWFIGDGETAAPDLQEQFSERLWRLPRPWLAHPTEVGFPEAEPLMQTDLPVVGCFGQAAKISATTLVIWSEILRQLPQALLVIKDRGLQDPQVRASLARKLMDHGVAEERIRMLPPAAEWSDHMECYNLLDVALDTTPWSSATTGFEALGMGVPLVAIRGGRLVSRMSSSLVKGLERSEWSGETPGQIAAAVVDLCRDLGALRREKRLRQMDHQRSALFDGVGMAEALMAAFAEMVS